MNVDNSKSDAFRLFVEEKPDFTQKVNIAFWGKENSGKSSLINAIMLREKDNPLAAVGVNPDVEKATVLRLDNNILIIESSDINDFSIEKNNERGFDYFDVAVFVVTDLVDSSLFESYAQLKECSKKEKCPQKIEQAIKWKLCY